MKLFPQCTYGFSLNCCSCFSDAGEISNFQTVFQVSIVAMQRGDQLRPFKTRSGDTLEILYLEELSAEVSVDSVHLLNTTVFVIKLQKQ